MNLYTLRQLSDTSWILAKDSSPLTLLIAKDGHLESIGKLEKTKFTDVTELESYLGSEVSVETSEEESQEELEDIDGYPVKHTGAIPTEHDTLPAYKRIANSNTWYAAGYYGIKFPNGWVTSYCPKLSTVTDNEYIGPFTTKLEMLNGISQKKRSIDV